MSPMENMPQMLALTILLSALFLGEVISTKTKALIPSIFVASVLFLLGYWTFFPQDIVARAGIPPVVAVMTIYMLIVNMGTLLSVRELINQWKTVTISLMSILGVIVISFTVGLLIFDWNTVVVAIPPLVGGIISATIMRDGALAAGLVSLSVFAVLVYVMQGFAGYALTSAALRKEGRRVLDLYRKGEWKPVGEENLSQEEVAKQAEGDEFPLLFQCMPKKYNSSYFVFLRLAVVGFAAYSASQILKPVIDVSPFVFCLLFGVIAKSYGFLEKQPLQKAGGFGFALIVIMLFILDTLQRATPQMILDLVKPLVILIVLCVLGLYIFSAIAGYFLKVSRNMAFAVALTALYGFPADYVITVEAINSLTEDEQERKVLTSHMIGPMLVGGFISVTIVSVVLAGFMVAWINKPFF